MSDGLFGLIVFIGVFIGTVIIAPWIGYAVHKYWDWCEDFQRRNKNVNR